MPSSSPRPKTSRDGPVVYHRRASWHPRCSCLTLQGPPPIPPRTYAPLPSELRWENAELWRDLSDVTDQDLAVPQLRLDLDLSNLRQRRLATKKARGPHLSSQLAFGNSPAGCCSYRRPALILKRHSRLAPRFRGGDHNPIKRVSKDEKLLKSASRKP